MTDSTNSSGEGTESPFEDAVKAALEARGWEVHTQIGVSSFRVDLGIVHPDAPGRYLAGVECDGATYHGSATARDRDRLRENVLVGLGWRIRRVWSTEWWQDDERTLLWAKSDDPSAPVAYREAENGQRDHGDIPLVELASLARTYRAEGADDEDIIRRMAVALGLGKLREATRRRFTRCLEENGV